MGGCRCTYRNCRVKSDGKTHMFHYPVFEKIRCHQWLINAHRLDFLDLKVSQLKNRVICQHHFKDECFMNFKVQMSLTHGQASNTKLQKTYAWSDSYKYIELNNDIEVAYENAVQDKGKLTFDAIPTEDGPYCDPSNYVDNNQVSSKLYCILVDDIDNDIGGCDKKANFSMKYGDFLTNLDVMDVEKTEQDNIACKPESSTLNFILPQENSSGKLLTDDSSFVFKLSLPDKCEKKTLSQPMLAVQPYINSNITSYNGPVKNYQQCKNGNVSYNNEQHISTYKEVDKTLYMEQNVVKKQPKITILSEKKITNPVSISGKFEPVSPNFVLNVSKVKDAKTNIAKLSLNQNSDNVPEYKEPFVQDIDLKDTSDQVTKIEIEIEPLKIKDENTQQPPYSLNVKSKSVSDKPSKISLLKPKVPPERLEAINKKRKFNMKLRDIIETCLDKLENADKTSEESNPAPQSPKIKKRVQRQHTTGLPKESPVVKTQDYTIAFLEARMRKMENILLEKIDQNSEKINDIKNMYSKGSSSRKSTIPSKVDEEAHKRELFQEISKYLSPSTKSLIYEELFINKFAVSDNSTVPKRKRRR